MLSLSLSNYLQATVTRAIFFMNVYVSNILYILSVSFHTYLKEEYNTGIESFFYL